MSLLTITATKRANTVITTEFNRKKIPFSFGDLQNEIIVEKSAMVNLIIKFTIEMFNPNSIQIKN